MQNRETATAKILAPVRSVLQPHAARTGNATKPRSVFIVTRLAVENKGVNDKNEAEEEDDIFDLHGTGRPI